MTPSEHLRPTVTVNQVAWEGQDTIFPLISSATALERLRATGWSFGETATADGWIVSAQRGDQHVAAHGATQAEA